MNTSTSNDAYPQIQKALEFIDQNKIDRAKAIFYQFTEIPHEDLNTLVNYGLLASCLDERIIAINVFSRVVEQEPNNATYLDLLAKALIDNGVLEGSKKLLNRAIELSPDFADPYIRLGAILINEQKYEQGAAMMEKAIALKPSEPTSYSNIIIPYRFMNRQKDALKHAKKLLKLCPDDPDSHETIARVYIELGQLEEATQHLEKSIRLDKSHGASYQHLAGIKKFSADSAEDQKFINRCETTLKGSLDPKSRSLIHFALGKIYNDCKVWDKAFEHYRQGNLISKPSDNQDQSNFKRFDKIKKSYTRKYIAETQNIGSTSEVPVFVVGMPRSGTTLIEQIVASHSAGAGAGELTAIDNIEKKICPGPDVSSYQKELEKNLNADTFQEHAEYYLNHLRLGREDAGRVVDKMPDNFFYLGLIKVLFPKSHVIHAVRNPLDTCLSCYFQSFTFLGWTYDLEWIASRYRFYRQAMAYWESVLPENSITELRYESLTEDPVNQTRFLIDSIDLPWEDQCLSFHKDQRTIITASVWQARQPIYKTSSRRWVNYAQHLEKLANGISEYLSEEDIEELARHGVKIKKKWRLKLF